MHRLIRAIGYAAGWVRGLFGGASADDDVQIEVSHAEMHFGDSTDQIARGDG
jgi:hypothetical protein